MTDLSPDRYNQAIELTYYAWQRLVAAPDRLLAGHGLARAHHRILYFVARHPGVSVGQLLRLLQITKQSLNRPLRDLVRHRMVVTGGDHRDGRIRRLQLTPAGAALERRLTGMQRRRFVRTFRTVGRGRERAWRQVMEQLGRR